MAFRTRQGGRVNQKSGRPKNGTKPKLLFVGSFVTAQKEKGGQNSQCLQLVASPLAEKCEFLLLDSTVLYYPPPAVPVRAWLAARRVARLLRILITRRPDAMLLFSSGGVSFLEKGMMAVIARGWGVPVIWSVRSGIFQNEVERWWLYRLVARALLRAPQRVLCQGESWANFYRERLGLPAGSLFVLPNWIEANRFATLAATEKPAKAGFRVLFVGHVKRSKGVFELTDALLDTPELAGVEADFVGDGQDRESLMSRVKLRGADRRIRFVGWRHGKDLLDYYAAADVLVLATYAEGFPSVLLEAMAAGLPVITTPVGGIPDVIEHGANGLLIPVGDVTALARAIASLQEAPSERHRMGRTNLDVVKNHLVEHAAARLWDELVTVSPAFAAAVPAGDRDPEFGTARDDE